MKFLEKIKEFFGIGKTENPEYFDEIVAEVEPKQVEEVQTDQVKQKKVWMHKGKSAVLVPKSDQGAWETKGYTRGRAKKTGKAAKAKKK